MSDIAHLGHVEVLTDRYDASLDFFTRVYGLKLSAEDRASAYLRAWDDYELHSLKLTRSERTGVGHIAYRAASPEALARRVAALEAMGCGLGWSDGDLGHGAAFQARSPSGHLFELYYDPGATCRRRTTARRSRIPPAASPARHPGGSTT